MVIVAYCRCGEPVTALHENAGAVQKKCKHPMDWVQWLALTGPEKQSPQAGRE